MSGGRFDYEQSRINDISESIQEVVNNNTYQYPEEVTDKFKIAIYKLKEAYIYAQRIDWLLSGDDGEESFLERLEEELKELDNE